MGKSLRWIAGLTLTAVVVVLVATLLVPRAFGLTPYVVTSGSMRPAFEPGAVVLTERVPTTELRVDDVITFRTPDGVTTHRIEQRTPAEAGTVQLVTRGDANNASDQEPIDARNVLGEVRVAVPAVGHLLTWVRSPWGAGSLALLLVLAIAGAPERDRSATVLAHPHARETEVRS